MILMRWDATDQIEMIDQPLLMIAGSKADSLYMTEDAFPKATGTKDKELFKIDGATHIETYCGFNKRLQQYGAQVLSRALCPLGGATVTFEPSARPGTRIHSVRR